MVLLQVVPDHSDDGLSILCQIADGLGVILTRPRLLRKRRDGIEQSKDVPAFRVNSYEKLNDAPVVRVICGWSGRSLRDVSVDFVLIDNSGDSVQNIFDVCVVSFLILTSVVELIDQGPMEGASFGSLTSSHATMYPTSCAIPSTALRIRDS